jgi:hypothetical protein
LTRFFTISCVEVCDVPVSTRKARSTRKRRREEDDDEACLCDDSVDTEWAKQLEHAPSEDESEAEYDEDSPDEECDQEECDEECEDCEEDCDEAKEDTDSGVSEMPGFSSEPMLADGYTMPDHLIPLRLTLLPPILRVASFYTNTSSSTLEMDLYKAV